MDKPTVFFSHSSKDKEALVRLKELFLQKTSETIEVFLSSDGQSIPLGRNWVYAVELGLRRAKLMIVFVTPSSLRSQWLYFESGYAYHQRLRVVPVGFRGVDLARVPPPLGLLQGFNITSEAGLDNIIAVANEEFEFTHGGRFTPGEYQEVMMLGADPADTASGGAWAYVEEIRMHLDSRENDMALEPGVWLEAIGEVLSERGVGCQKEEGQIHFDGVSVTVIRTMTPTPMDFEIDPWIFGACMPNVEAILKRVRKEGVNGVVLRVLLREGVQGETQKHRVSSRLHGSLAHLEQSGGFVYEGVWFDMDVAYAHPDRRRPFVRMRIAGDTIPVMKVRQLLELLLARRVLWVCDEREIMYAG